MLHKCIANVLGVEALASQPLMEVCDGSHAPAGAAAKDVTYLAEESAALQAGLDSLGAVELRTAIGSAFGLDLPSTFAFDYPTQAAMAAYVLQAIAMRDVHPSQAEVRKDASIQVPVMLKLTATPCLREAGAREGPQGCAQRRSMSGGRSVVPLSFGDQAQCGRAERAARRQPILA